MNLTAEKIKEFAKKQGVDLVGIASIDRFEGAPPHLHPQNIFPETKSVVVIGLRYLRGSFRGIEEGTYWLSYSAFGDGYLNVFIQMVRDRICDFIESYGWEAVGVEPDAAYPEYEGFPKEAHHVPGRLSPEVIPSLRFAAVAAGLGEIGYSKVFLSPEFGPLQRLGMILTDAPLKPDPLFDGKICDRCMRCVAECPSGAISKKETVKIKIGNKTVEWGKLDTGKCKLSHTGMNRQVSPFIAMDIPGFHLDISKQKMTWREAREFAHTLWARINYCHTGTGYHSICGARGCIRTCMVHLERRGKLTGFHSPFRKRKPWLLPE